MQRTQYWQSTWVPVRQHYITLYTDNDVISQLIIQNGLDLCLSNSQSVRLGLAIVPWYRRPPPLRRTQAPPGPFRNFLIMVTISVDRQHYR